MSLKISHPTWKIPRDNFINESYQTSNLIQKFSRKERRNTASPSVNITSPYTNITTKQCEKAPVSVTNTYAN